MGRNVTDPSSDVVRPIIAPLELSELQLLEAECCRATLRKDWWNGASNSQGCLGNMVRHFLDRQAEFESRRMAKAKAGAGKEDQEKLSALNQKELLACLLTHPKDADRLRVITKASLNKFLKGKPTGIGWYSVARAALQYILLGTDESHEMPTDRSATGSQNGKQDKNIQNDSVAETQSVVANRILNFFFGQQEHQLMREPPDIPPDRVWYFHNSIRRFEIPATSHEATAELRSLVYYANSTRKKKCSIFRISGKCGFKQVTDDFKSLTRTGELTVDCLRAGVHVVYMYPNLPVDSAENDAVKSVQSFLALARERLSETPQHLENLRLFPIDPQLTRIHKSGFRWAGEFLSPILVFALYQREDSPRTLIISRQSNQEMTVFSPDHGEKEALSSWISAFYEDALDAAHGKARKKSAVIPREPAKRKLEQ